MFINFRLLHCHDLYIQILTFHDPQPRLPLFLCELTSASPDHI